MTSDSSGSDSLTNTPETIQPSRGLFDWEQFRFGIAALLLERNPTLSRKDVMAALRESAHKVEGDAAKDTGAGVADAAGAIEAVH